MKDKKFIIIGLIIGLVVFTFPFWYNIGQEKPFSDVILSQKAKDAGKCILSAEEMRTEHMRILDEWREKVVREGERQTRTADGRTFEMSLSNTCLDCHHNREDFCIKCHDYASVRNYCWDCHVNPADGVKELAQ